MKKRPLLIGLVLAALFALWLFPSSSLAAPYWEVVVVDEHGKPVEGMTVRETWQNYSVETEGHEADRQTDANGHATFPAQKAEYSCISTSRQLGSTLLSAVTPTLRPAYRNRDDRLGRRFRIASSPSNPTD